MLIDIESVLGNGSYRIKDKEKARVFATVCHEGLTTRKRLVEILGIRPTTVSNSIQQLVEDRLVLEQDLINSGRQGRPEISLGPNFDRICAIALVTVSQKIRGVLINLGQQILADESRELDREAGNRALTRVLEDLLQSLLDKKPPGSEVAGIGISLPGDVNGETERWLFNARWKNIRNFSFRKIADNTGLPFRLIRMLDAELGYQLLEHPEYGKGGTLLFHWGFGIGAAYANQGTVNRSTLGSFIEIGHISLAGNMRKTCTCGEVGCVETEAALWSLIEEIRRIQPDAPEDETLFSGYLSTIPYDQVSAILERAKTTIVESLNVLYRMFYPDRILIYGPFTDNPSIESELKDQFRQRIPSFARNKVRLVIFHDRNAAGKIFGSTLELFRRSLQDYLVVH